MLFTWGKYLYTAIDCLFLLFLSILHELALKNYLNVPIITNVKAKRKCYLGINANNKIEKQSKGL